MSDEPLYACGLEMALEGGAEVYVVMKGAEGPAPTCRAVFVDRQDAERFCEQKTDDGEPCVDDPAVEVAIVTEYGVIASNDSDIEKHDLLGERIDHWKRLPRPSASAVREQRTSGAAESAFTSKLGLLLEPLGGLGLSEAELGSLRWLAFWERQTVANIAGIFRQCREARSRTESAEDCFGGPTATRALQRLLDDHAHSCTEPHKCTWAVHVLARLFNEAYPEAAVYDGPKESVAALARYVTKVREMRQARDARRLSDKEKDTRAAEIRALWNELPDHQQRMAEEMLGDRAPQL